MRRTMFGLAMVAALLPSAAFGDAAADCTAALRSYNDMVDRITWCIPHLFIGMSKDQVLLSCAYTPNHTNQTLTAGGLREQWIYELSIDDPTRHLYLYFNNGYLEAVQN
jgi:hypothetical protein